MPPPCTLGMDAFTRGTVPDRTGIERFCRLGGVVAPTASTRYGGSRRALYAGGGGSLRAAPATPRDRGLDGPVRRQRGPCRAAGFCHHASPQCRQAVARHGTTYCCPPRISSKPSWCATKSIVTKRSLCCGSPHARSRWKGLHKFRNLWHSFGEEGEPCKCNTSVSGFGDFTG